MLVSIVTLLVLFSCRSHPFSLKKMPWQRFWGQANRNNKTPVKVDPPLENPPSILLRTNNASNCQGDDQ